MAHTLAAPLTHSAGSSGSRCCARWSASACSRRVSRSTSWPATSRASPTSRSARRPSRPAPARTCGATTRSPRPTAATATPWPRAPRCAGMVAELFARSTGICKGKGGSMHIADFSVGMLGANGVVAGGFGLVAGAALERAAAQDRSGRGVLLRRRRDQPRSVPREPQLVRDLEPAGDLRPREQPVRLDHLDRRDDEDRRRRAARGRLRHTVGDRRRVRRVRGARRRRRGSRARARRRRADLRRVQDLSRARALHRRPRALPREEPRSPR